MRNISRVLIALILPAILLCGAVGFTAAETGTEVTTTVLVYLCGSNLETDGGAAAADIGEMLQSGFDANKTNVIILAGGAKEWSPELGLKEGTTHILRLKASARQEGTLRIEESEAVPDMNMGESGTLLWFLNYGYENAPADRYALILWDHGCGPAQGLCLDENHGGDALTLNELGEALSAGPFAENPLEWIGFDACLMCTVETASRVAPYSRYMIASEETEPSGGWDYSFLKGLEADADGAATGKRIVDTYFASLAGSLTNLTMSCVDLSRVNEVEDAMDRFYLGLAKGLDASTYAGISSLRTEATGFGKSIPGSGYDTVDVASLSGCYAELDPEGAAAVQNAVSAAVVYNRSNVEGSAGLAAYHPYSNKTDYLESWKAGYEALNFCDGYSAYIASYGTVLTGEQLIRWNRPEVPMCETAEDGTVLCTLSLTESERKNIASARLLVVAKNMYDAADDAYAGIFSTSNVTVSETGLSAVYDDTCVEIYHTACIESATGAIDYQTTEDGTYLIRFTPEGGSGTCSGQEIYGEYVREEGTDRLLLKRYLAYDALAGRYIERTDVDFSDCTGVTFRRNYRVQTENLYGEHPGFADWRAGTHKGDGYSISGTDFTPIFRKRSVGDYLYVMFEITDLQGNTYTSELGRIEGGVNAVSGRITSEAYVADNNDAPSYTVDRINLIRRSAEEKGNRYILLRAVVTNTGERDVFFKLDNVCLNGVEFSDLYAYNADGTGADCGTRRALAPGEARAVTLKLYPDTLLGLVPDTELSTITARLKCMDIRDGNLHVLGYEDISIVTDISLADYTPEAAVLPYREAVMEAESEPTQTVNTSNELLLFENEQCRVSLAGFYTVDGRVVILADAENLTDRTLTVSLFHAKINGADAIIGESENVSFLTHNNRASVFHLSEAEWESPRHARLSLKGKESRREYITVAPGAEGATELEEVSFCLYIKDSDDLSKDVFSEKVVIACTQEPAPLQEGLCVYPTADMLSVTAAEVSEETGKDADILIIGEVPEQIPVYRLTFTEPDNKAIQGAYYYIFKNLDSDRELAEQLITDNELFQTGHGYLMKIAVGAAELSGNGTSVEAEYMGVIPVLSYKDSSVPFVTMLQSHTADTLTLCENGNALIYGSAEFSHALNKADLKIRFDIGLETGEARVTVGGTSGTLPPDVSLTVSQKIFLLSTDAEEYDPLGVIEQTDDTAYYVTLPLRNRTVETGLETLDDPENYSVIFYYLTADGEVLTSEPMPLSDFTKTVYDRGAAKK